MSHDGIEAEAHDVRGHLRRFERRKANYIRLLGVCRRKATDRQGGLTLIK